MDYERYYSYTNTHLFLLGYINMHKPGDSHSVEQCIEYGRQLVYDEIDTFFDSVKIKRYSKIGHQAYKNIMHTIKTHGEHTPTFQALINGSDERMTTMGIDIVLNYKSKLADSKEFIASLESLCLHQDNFMIGIDYIGLYDAKEREMYPEDFKERNVIYAPITNKFMYKFSGIYFIAIAFSYFTLGLPLIAAAMAIRCGYTFFGETYQTSWDAYADDWAKNYDWETYRKTSYNYDCTMLSLLYGGDIDEKLIITNRPYPLFGGGRLNALKYIALETIAFISLCYAAQTAYTFF